MRLEVLGEMGIKMGWVIPTHVEEAPALGLPHFGTPECLRAIQRPGRQRGTGSEAGFQHLATAEPCGMSETHRLWTHRNSSP